ncbi:MAG: TonB-dependent receptor [Candidatus Acidiferrum sp.]
MKKMVRFISVFAVLICFVSLPAQAQQTLGSITGTVTDSSGGMVQNAAVKVHNLATGLEQTATTNSEGSYNIADLPIGIYSVSFSRDGFKSEVHSQISVQGNRTTTVNGSLQPGAVSTTVTVTGTSLMNMTDTTNGYVLGTSEINEVPLGTGSLTQLAILTPGVNADLLNGSGTNAGLGNQSIWANGQRDTSNSFTVNGVDSTNLFNGKTSSQVASNRFVLNTNESFLGGNGEDIQTSTSVYDAIGQALPTPPIESLDEIRVNASMYDASQGANSGAHIDSTTKSGTNLFHGEVYEYHQSDAWNAAPFFRNSDPTIPSGEKVPRLHYNRFGATLGGPILKNKLFFFASYQGIRTTDQLNGTSSVGVPVGLTDNNRTAQGLTDLLNSPEYCDPTMNPTGCYTISQISPAAVKLFQAKLPDGQYLIPSAKTVNNGYDVTLQSAASFTADQANANLDYDFSAKDRLSGKYYFQSDPGTNPFAVSSVEGFSQSLNAGSQLFSLLNTTVLTPNLTWDQKFGFVRMRAFAGTQQPLTPSDAGINLFGSQSFPGIYIKTTSGLNDNLFGSTSIGPNSNFANAGIFQNRWDVSSNLNWVHGRHTASFGFNWNTTQLNVINKNNEVASLTFNDWPSFITGAVTPGLSNSAFFNGTSNRYYRAKQAGLYANDKIRLSSSLSVTLGLRWDWDGPLTEKYGNLTNFYPQDYSYDLGTDTVTNIGLVVAGNNKTFGTKGVSNSTMIANQWALEPRIGLAWNPSFYKNMVIRAGYGLYADRGQFFTEFSPSAGFGYNGPFGVTLAPPFVVPLAALPGATLDNPFGTTAPPPPPKNLSQVAALVPCQGLYNGGTCSSPQAGGITTSGLIQGTNPFLFGGYDPYNKLPYSENWTLDLQWQPWNSWVFTLGYVGNHGQHLTLPIPFNQPKIATPANPVNGQMYSYGFQPLDSMGNPLLTEPYFTSTGGNTDLRTSYLGYSPNSVYYEGEGISNYNALQVSATKRLSKGLSISASYTWSHTLDEQSGLGLFYTGNNPLDPRSGYGNADFDRTHVAAISYQYELPKLTNRAGFRAGALNGWSISGVTILQSGQPYSVYDYSGAVGGIYYSGNDYITNPIVPILSGPPASAITGHLGTDPNFPALNPSAFGVVTLAPGTSGVAPCGPTATTAYFCDTVETGFSNVGRNTFRGPFQNRFDFSVMKLFRINERFQLKYRFDAFNIFNHPSFDTPNNDITLNPCYGGASPGCYLGPGPAGNGQPAQGSLGVIQHTIGSPRFIQMSLRLLF